MKHRDGLFALCTPEKETIDRKLETGIITIGIFLLFALCSMYRFSRHLTNRLDFVSLFSMVSAFAEMPIFIEKYLTFVSFSPSDPSLTWGGNERRSCGQETGDSKIKYQNANCKMSIKNGDGRPETIERRPETGDGRPEI